jgi:Fe2+ or Zn2+ uptake regulation protein
MSHHEQMLNQFEQNHTLSVSDIQEAIPDAKQSEIYKNLMQMEQDGVIERVQTKGTIKYELAKDYEEHDHFVCKDCDAVKAIHVDAEGLNDHVVQGSNFSVTIESVCADCR